MPKSEPHHKGQQRNRVYSDALLAVIEDLHWNEGLEASCIAGRVGLPIDKVRKLMSVHGLNAGHVGYKAAKFSGWSFHEDNLEGLRS